MISSEDYKEWVEEKEQESFKKCIKGLKSNFDDLFYLMHICNIDSIHRDEFNNYTFKRKEEILDVE